VDLTGRDNGRNGQELLAESDTVGHRKLWMWVLRLCVFGQRPHVLACLQELLNIYFTDNVLKVLAKWELAFGMGLA